MRGFSRPRNFQLDGMNVVHNRSIIQNCTMRKETLIICLLMAFFLGGCGNGNVQTPIAEAPHIIEQPLETSQTSQIDNCSFSDCLERFIECYNACCRAYGNKNLLQETGWNYNNDCWHYKQYENIWTEPELQVFVDDAGSIREIRIAFEDHGYTEWGEALSEERAFYTLRCLCGDKSDEELTQIIEEARSEMRETTEVEDPGAEIEVTSSRVCGDYELYHFFSGGVYYLCVRGAEAGS